MGIPTMSATTTSSTSSPAREGFAPSCWSRPPTSRRCRTRRPTGRPALDRLAGLAPLPAAPGLAALKIMSLFQPFRPFSQHTRTYEQSTPEAITIGTRRFVGWSYAGGAVAVLRSQGHCAGHVIVYLRDNKLLHMGDEVNGPCPVMHDADQHKLSEVQAPHSP